MEPEFGSPNNEQNTEHYTEHYTDEMINATSSSFPSRFSAKSTNLVLNELITFISSYIDVNNSEDRINWDCIPLALEKFSMHHGLFLHVYIEIIFSVFEVLRCTNYEIICHWLNEFALRRLSLINFEPPLCLHKVFYDPMAFMKLENVQRLVRYGVSLKFEDCNSRTFLDTILASIANRQHTLRGDTVQIEERIRNLHPTAHNPKRQYLILLAIKVVFMNRKFDICINESFRKSVRLFIETFPDPLVSISEVRSFFDIIIKEERKDPFISRFCDEFLELMPQSTVHLQPRSLKHLSRIQVRECLVLAGKLPHGVWNLDLPLKMCNYILLQNKEDDFYPRYVPYFLSNNEDCAGPSCSKKQTTS